MAKKRAYEMFKVVRHNADGEQEYAEVPGWRLSEHFALTMHLAEMGHGEASRPKALTHIPSGRRLGDGAWALTKAQRALEVIAQVPGWHEENPMSAIDALRKVVGEDLHSWLEEQRRPPRKRKSFLTKLLEDKAWCGAKVEGPMLEPLPSKMKHRGGMGYKHEEAQAYKVTHPSGAVAFVFSKHR
jgi:hypothetical protein